jgi:hypothetical protein
VLPSDIVLGQQYPNPFAPLRHGVMTIPFTLGQAGPVRLVITDVLGRVVRVLTDSDHAAGMHSVQWDGRDAFGAAVTAGVYFVQLTSGSVSHSARITILR